MAILEGLGPKRKIFDDLEPGDYLFEITNPSDSGWTIEFVDKDDFGAPTEAKATYISWKLRVLQPEEFANKPQSHLTMISATPEKLMKAKRPYDPAGFTFQFLAQIGAAVVQSGEAIVLDEYLTKGSIDLDKLIGLRFWGSMRSQKGKDGVERINLVKCWVE